MDHRAFTGQLDRNLRALDDWAETWEPYEVDPTLRIDPVRVAAVMDDFMDRMRENYPYHHPRYAGQMLKPPHPVAMLAYATAMFVNPNNHALDGGIATSKMEKEVVVDLARMFGYPEAHLGHLTASGTIANLEALWIARSVHPDKAIVISDQAHYTHGRACELLRIEARTVATDQAGRIDLDHLRGLLAADDVGTVVATAGTTGFGSVDPIHEIRRMTAEAGARLHVDAAYGGFFTLLAQQADPPLDPAPFQSISQADSVVVDPHKHGLQPYGCGAVLFRDPAVGRYYQHDSPYTYFTSEDLHLGEISLECSRAGASAAALWATLQCFPLEPDSGLGPVLARTCAAAKTWSDLIREDGRFQLVVDPDLDIVSFYALPPGLDSPRAGQISALTEHIFTSTEQDPHDPVYLATLRVDRRQIEARGPEIVWDQPTLTVLRCVVMKPEHADWVPRIHAAISRHLPT